jgi:uncharacterized membrane protein
MKMMGLRASAWWFGWWLQSIFTSSISAAAMTFTLFQVGYLKFSSSVLIWLIIVLFALSLTTLASMLACFFDRVWNMISFISGN